MVSPPANASPSAFWNRHATRYDRSMRLLGGPMARALHLTAEVAQGAASVLEVAAGTGLFTRALAGVAAHVTATDFAESMVVELRRRVEAEGLSNVTCAQADVYALTYGPASFNVVVAANVLHLLPDLPGALAAMGLVLKPGGLLVAPTFCHDETLSSRVVSCLLALTGFPSARRFTTAALAEAIAAAGFEPLRSETIPGLLPIGFVAGRAPALQRGPESC